MPKTGTIPTLTAYTSLPEGITKANPNDNSNYYVIDLKKLENLTLNYGKNYQSSSSSNDVYIINEQSHNIYYAKGITLDNKIYYTTPGTYQVVN